MLFRSHKQVVIPLQTYLKLYTSKTVSLYLESVHNMRLLELEFSRFGPEILKKRYAKTRRKRALVLDDSEAWHLFEPLKSLYCGEKYPMTSFCPFSSVASSDLGE